MIRIGMAPVIAYLILHSQYSPAVGLFAVAGVTDLVSDGKLLISFGRYTLPKFSSALIII